MLVFACKANELADGEGRPALDAPNVAVFRVGDDFYATQDSCSHEEWSLGEDGELEGYEVVCPLHQARFDIRDGRPLCLPALSGLKTYPVVVRGCQVMIDIPDGDKCTAGEPTADLSSAE